MEALKWERSRRFTIDTDWLRATEAIFTELVVARAARSLLKREWQVAHGSDSPRHNSMTRRAVCNASSASLRENSDSASVSVSSSP